MTKIYCFSLAMIVITMAFVLPVYADDVPPPAGWESVIPLLSTADVNNGQKVSHVCGSCHTFDKGDGQKLGPNLYSIVNKTPGQTEGFPFSDAMKARQDKKWTYDALDRFLFDPKSYVPDTRMNFFGIKKTQDRADLIAWLRTQSDKPAPLPKRQKSKE